MLAIFTIFLTIQSDTRSDNNDYNEDEQIEEWYYDYPPNGEPLRIWKVKQHGSDSEDSRKLQTSVSIKAAQTSLTHALYAYAWFHSGYTYPRIKGDWYLRAALHHDWATDENAYERRGVIRGRSGGMSEMGDQSDIDYFANRNPFQTKRDCDAYAEAKVHHPSKNKDYKSVSYSHFTSINIKWKYEERP